MALRNPMPARIAPLSPLKGAYPLQTSPDVSEFLRNSETLGELLEPTLVGIIADLGRFHSGVKLRCYKGFCPKQDDSGQGSKKGLPATKEEKQEEEEADIQVRAISGSRFGT